MELFTIFLIGGIVAGFSLTIVFLIMYFIKPALDTPARFFIEARRKKKPVYILDAGKMWKFVVPEYVDMKYAKKGNEIIFRGDTNAEKMAYGGVLVGVGENERSLLVAGNTAEMIARLKEKGVDADKLKEILDEIKKNEKEIDKEKDKNKWRLVDLSAIRDFVNFALNKNLINLIIKRNVDVETREALMNKRPEKDWYKLLMYIFVGLIVAVFIFVLVRQLFGVDMLTQQLVQCKTDLAKCQAIREFAKNTTKILHG